MDKDIEEYVNIVGWCNRDICQVTRSCNELTHPQKDIIDAIRNFQEVSENIPITFEMLDNFIPRNLNSIRRNSKVLDDLGIIKRTKTARKPTTLSLNIKGLDKFLKKNSPYYDELIASAGMNYIDVYHDKKAHLRQTGLITYSILEKFNNVALSEETNKKWLSE